MSKKNRRKNNVHGYDEMLCVVTALFREMAAQYGERVDEIRRTVRAGVKTGRSIGQIQADCDGGNKGWPASHLFTEDEQTLLMSGYVAFTYAAEYWAQGKCEEAAEKVGA